MNTQTKPLDERSDSCGSSPDQFIVSHGKSGVLGVFTAAAAVPLRRGQRVIVRTGRGVEMGQVLSPATLRQARLLGATSAGQLLRRADEADEARRAELAFLEQQLFDAARSSAETASLALEILDVDLLFDGQQAIVQFVGSDAETDRLAHALEVQFRLTVRLENLAVPSEPEEHGHGGCDKPDCGKTAGGGCTTCSTGGGCSSCGSGKVDLRPYFGHLRDKMEAKGRIALA
jgi:cell fate regulator YaaT (PSP1 superfamily)